MNWDIIVGGTLTSFWFVSLHIFVLAMCEDDEHLE